jgi:hypothetical protein
MLRFFGPRKFLKQDEEHVPTPLGVECVYCLEAIKEGDMGTITGAGQAMHYECGMRGIVGSLAHQLQKCQCFGGDGEDPPGMSVRQAAIASCRQSDARQAGVLTYKVEVGPTGPKIECLRCGSVSSNPVDIQNRYCGRCHAPHADPRTDFSRSSAGEDRYLK